jgi:flagellar protein FliL
MAESIDKKPMSTLSTLAVVLGLTILIGTVGAFLGMKLAPTPTADRPAEPPAAEEHGGDHDSSAHDHEQPARKSSAHVVGKPVLKELSPIVTNLSDSGANWIRLQIAIVYDQDAVPHADILMSELTADIVAYVRTLSLRSIEGGAGLRRLNEELSERASIRSDGAVQELIIQSLVVQ